jgi:magnesium transporter
MDAIREEETEDAQRMAGMGVLEYSYSRSSLVEMVKKRASAGSSVLFIGESFTATAMGFFEGPDRQGGGAGAVPAADHLQRGQHGLAGEHAHHPGAGRGRRHHRRNGGASSSGSCSVGLMLGVLLGVIGFLRVAVWSQFTDLYGPHWA